MKNQLVDFLFKWQTLLVGFPGIVALVWQILKAWKSRNLLVDNCCEVEMETGQVRSVQIANLAAVPIQVSELKFIWVPKWYRIDLRAIETNFGSFVGMGTFTVDRYSNVTRINEADREIHPKNAGFEKGLNLTVCLSVFGRKKEFRQIAKFK